MHAENNYSMSLKFARTGLIKGIVKELSAHKALAVVIVYV